MLGGRGDDIVVGGNGADVLFGGLGADTFVYGPLVAGEAEVGVAVAAAGANVIEGDENSNDLMGTDGNDIIDGNEAADTLTGGLGRDIFRYDSFDDGTVVFEADGETLILDETETITDFVTGPDGDAIDISALVGSPLDASDDDPLGTLFDEVFALGFRDTNDGTLISVGEGFESEILPMVFVAGVQTTDPEGENFLGRDNFIFGIDSDPVIGNGDGEPGDPTIEAPEGGDVIVDFDVDNDALDFAAVVKSLGIGDDPFGDGGIQVEQSGNDAVVTVDGLDGPITTLLGVDAEELTDENWIFA